MINLSSLAVAMGLLLKAMLIQPHSHPLYKMSPWESCSREDQLTLIVSSSMPNLESVTQPVTIYRRFYTPFHVME